MFRLTHLFVAVTFLVLIAGPSRADIQFSNRDSSPTPGTAMGGSNAKAVGFVTGPNEQTFQTMFVQISTDGLPGNKTLTGGLYTDVGGQPGLLIEPFVPLTISPGFTDVRFPVFTERQVKLKQTTAYWAVLDSPDGTTAIIWEGGSQEPRTSATTTFLGYRFSTTNGATWSTSNVRNRCELVTIPPPSVSNLPVITPTTGTVLGDGNDKAVGITIGPRPMLFECMTVQISNPTGSFVIFQPSIHEDAGGNPGAEIASLIAITVPPNSASYEEDTVSSPIAPRVLLDANTTYWFKLSDPGSVRIASWNSQSPSTPPQTIDGVSFAGYRFTANGGATWGVSGVNNALSIVLRPEPLVANLPGDTSGADTRLGSNGSFDSEKAIGFTTGASGHECPRFGVVVNNETSVVSNDLFGTLHRDNNGSPGAVHATMNSFSLVPTQNDVYRELRPEDPFVRLAPNTRYWLVLDGSDNPETINWPTLSPSTLPATAPGITLDGYLFSNTGGASWSASTFYNAISIIANSYCVCDVAPNGLLNLDDLDVFVAAFLNNGIAADIDGNGLYNLDDLGLFVDCFLAGCP